MRKLFPDRSEEVSRLALRNEAFRTLCEEYGLAVEAFERLGTRNLPQDAKRMAEYRTLIDELTSDLQREFAAARARETHGG